MQPVLQPYSRHTTKRLYTAPIRYLPMTRGPVWCITTTLALILSGHKTAKGQYGKHGLRIFLWKKEVPDGPSPQRSQLIVDVDGPSA